MKTKDLLHCSLAASLIILLSQISIPFAQGVPFTLQTLAIPLCAVVLGAKKGAISSIIYILIGAIGLPVFSNFSGGPSVIFGPTGGFILSFPIMAYIVGYFSKKSNNKFYIFIIILISSIINFMFGILVFSFITNSTLNHSFMVCVLPFIPSTILKSFASSYLGVIIKSRIYNGALN